VGAFPSSNPSKFELDVEARCRTLQKEIEDIEAKITETTKDLWVYDTFAKRMLRDERKFNEIKELEKQKLQKEDLYNRNYHSLKKTEGLKQQLQQTKISAQTAQSQAALTTEIRSEVEKIGGVEIIKRLNEETEDTLQAARFIDDAVAAPPVLMNGGLRIDGEEPTLASDDTERRLQLAMDKYSSPPVMNVAPIPSSSYSLSPYDHLPVAPNDIPEFHYGDVPPIEDPASLSFRVIPPSKFRLPPLQPGQMEVQRKDYA
jgi:hypothetical protein